MIDRDLRRALAFIVPYWRRLVLVLLLSALSTALSLYLPLLSRDFFDHALIGRDLRTLVRVGVLFTVFAAASFVVNVVSGLRYTRVSADILFDMRLQMYRHLQRLSPRFHARTRIGDVMSRINNDVGEIQRIAAETALAWVGNVLFLCGTTVMLAWLDMRLFLVTIATAPLGLWLLARYRRKLEAEITTLRQRSADIGSFLIETLQAVKLIVASNAQEREVAAVSRTQRLLRAVADVDAAADLSVGRAARPDPRRRNRPRLRLRRPSRDPRRDHGRDLRRVHGVPDALPAAAAGADGDVREPGDRARLAAPRLADSRRAGRGAGGAGAVALAAVKGDVAFEDVTVSFNRGEPALERLSFRVRAGEVLAIVGRSGSGKSTIADLLLRLLDPDAGVVRVDGHDLRTVRLDDLRRHVALVDQEPCMFHTTIAENIRYARPDATDAEVAAAAHQAALDDFIGRLPDKLATVVGERGMALSAGERQRIAVARAFLANPSILILDEPSAALDPESERQVAEGYEAVMRGRTTIVITHRLELAARADRVLELDDERAPQGV